MSSATIRQTVTLPAAPARVYAVLLSANDFSAFTGGREASIDAKAGGAFSMFGGHITGRTVELNPDTRIVQAWRSKTWPEGHYSIVRFDIAAEGAGSTLTLEHSGFPVSEQAHLTEGWSKMYWEPLKKHLA